MKFKLRKYIYFVNDLTNLLLNKDRIQDEESAKKLRAAVIIVSIILALSLALNFYLIFTR